MKIFKISHLFQTPVASSVEPNSQNKKSRRRRRRRRTPKNGSVQNVSDNLNPPPCAEIKSDNCTPKQVEAVKSEKKEAASILPKQKKSKKKSKCDLAAKSRVLGSSKKSSQPSKATFGACCDPTQTQVTENMKQEMLELIHSLQTMASEKDILKKNLSDLREENDRLVRNNEDLKDELKEMTDEALELTVEKQRLLSKIGVLKKQLLNKPK